MYLLRENNKKYFIMFGVLAIIVALSFLNTSTINNITGYSVYQPGPDAYTCSGNWDPSHPCENIVDGDISSSTHGDASSGTATIQINYTKPTGARQNGTVWYTYDSGIPGTANNSISDACWNAYEDKLVFEVTLSITIGTNADVYCGGEAIFESHAGVWYDTAMYWELDETDPEITIDAPADDYDTNLTELTVNMTIDGTGTFLDDITVDLDGSEIYSYTEEDGICNQLQETTYQYQEEEDDYTCGGTWDIFNTCGNVVDGDWDFTYGTVPSSGTIDIEYTKPIGATSASKWELKHLSRVNYTLPDACWNAYPDKLIFNVTVTNLIDRYTSATCGGVAIFTDLVDISLGVYEEAMWWSTTSGINTDEYECSIQLTDLAEGHHTLGISATDLGPDNGNTATADYDFTVDRTGPTITDITLENITATTADVSAIFIDELTEVLAAVTVPTVEFSTNALMIPSNTESLSRPVLSHVYQEDPDSYECFGDKWDFFNGCDNVVDGDYNTYALTTSGLSTPEAWIVMEYTKPEGAVAVNWTGNIAYYDTNATVPDSCWDMYSDKVVIRLDANGPTGGPKTKLYCADETGWQRMIYWSSQLTTTLTSPVEDQIIWWVVPAESVGEFQGTMNPLGVPGGLEPATKYYYRVYAYDILDNVKYSDIYSFYTLVQNTTGYTSDVSTPVEINVTENAGEKKVAELIITTSSSLTGTVTATLETTNPGSEFENLVGAGVYLDIESDELNETTLNEVEIRVYYNQTEIEALGIDESSLKLYVYETPDWVEVANSGVNTEEDYTWGITNHFSIYAPAGSLANGESCSIDNECNSGACCSGTCEDECPSSSGGSSRHVYETYDWEEETFEGYLSATDKLDFEFDGNDHTIIIVSTLEDKVVLWVRSSQQTVEINTGETKYVDLNEDEVNDISLYLDRIEGTEAYFVFEKIVSTPVAEEPTPEPTPEPAEEMEEEIIDEEPIPKTEADANRLQYITVVVIAGSTGILLFAISKISINSLHPKRRHRRKTHKKKK